MADVVQNIHLKYVAGEHGRPQTPRPRPRPTPPANGEMRRRRRTPLTGLPPPNAEEVDLEPVTFSVAFIDSGLTPGIVVQALQATTPERLRPRFALCLPAAPGAGLAFRSGKRWLVGKRVWSRILAASGGENSLDPTLIDAVTSAMRDPADLPPLVGTMMVLLDRDCAEMRREADDAAAAGDVAALERLSWSCANGRETLEELAGNADALTMILTIATGAADEEGRTQVRHVCFWSRA